MAVFGSKYKMVIVKKTPFGYVHLKTKNFNPKDDFVKHKEDSIKIELEQESYARGRTHYFFVVSGSGTYLSFNKKTPDLPSNVVDAVLVPKFAKEASKGGVSAFISQYTLLAAVLAAFAIGFIVSKYIGA